MLSTKTKRSRNSATALLRIAAVNVGKIGAFYRRLAVRAGKAKAVTATARKLAILFYSLLKHGSAYVERGAEAYETHYRNRVVINLRKRAKQMGYELVSVATTEVQCLEVS